jgi:hypothetical protein
MDAAEVPQVSPTLGGCHPLKTWVISPLESPKKLPKMGYTGARGDLYQFPFGRNNDEFGHSHVLPTQQMIISFCLPSNHHFCQDTASIVDYQRHHGVSSVYPHPMDVVVL